MSYYRESYFQENPNWSVLGFGGHGIDNYFKDKKMPPRARYQAAGRLHRHNQKVQGYHSVQRAVRQAGFVFNRQRMTFPGHRINRDLMRPGAHYVAKGKATGRGPTRYGGGKGKGKGKGKGRGKARRGRGKRPAYTRGCSEVVEYRGTLSEYSYGAMYLGHGVSANRIFFNIIRCVVKELCKQAGESIEDFQDLLVTPLRKRFYFDVILDPAATPPVETAVVIVPAAGWTYNDVVNNYILQIRATVTNALPGEILTFYLNDPYQDPIAMSGEPRIATIVAKQFFVDIFYSSSLKIQNRTLANLADVNQDLSNDITNNPLVGKLYKKPKKWSNAVRPITRSTPEANPLVLSQQYGFLSAVASAQNTQILIKPPAPWVLGFKDSVAVKVNPGGMLRDAHTFKCKMALSTFWQKNAGIVDTGNAQISNIGKVGLVGLEKELDSAAAAGTPIHIGFQVDQKYMVAYKYSPKIRTIPYMDVALVPVIAT